MPKGSDSTLLREAQQIRLRVYELAKSDSSVIKISLLCNLGSSTRRGLKCDVFRLAI